MKSSIPTAYAASYSGPFVTPVLVEELNDAHICKISSGAQHAMALSRDGQVWSFGDGSVGQLGHGSDTCVKMRKPRRVDAVKHKAIVEVECGYYHSALLTGSLELLMCGWNYYRQCGQESRKNVLDFTYVASMRGIDISSVSLGSLHTAAVTERGLVYTWGDDWYGQRATGKAVARKGVAKPRLLESLSEADVVSVSAGDFHTVAVTRLRGGAPTRCYSWGRNGPSGRLGIGSPIPVVPEPNMVFIEDIGRADAKKASSGDFHSGVVLDDGRLYTWGGGENGALGHGTNRFNELIPKCVEYFVENGIKVKDVACGGGHTLCVSDEGELYSFGNNLYGKLGLGDNNDRCVPCKVTALEGKKVIQVSAGLWHSMCLTEDEQVYIFGRLYDTRQRKPPVPMIL